MDAPCVLSEFWLNLIPSVAQAPWPRRTLSSQTSPTSHWLPTVCQPTRKYILIWLLQLSGIETLVLPYSTKKDTSMLIELSSSTLKSIFNQCHMDQQWNYTQSNNKAAIPSLVNGTNQHTLGQEGFQNTDSKPHTILSLCAGPMFFTTSLT